MEFKEFEPRFKSAKTRFKLSVGLNLETFEWNQPYLSRGLNLNRRSNSLNSLIDMPLNFRLKRTLIHMGWGDIKYIYGGILGVYIYIWGGILSVYLYGGGN